MRKAIVAISALSIALAATSASAQYRGQVVVDGSFGASGFAAVPQLDPTYIRAHPIGFVRLPMSGGYLFASWQRMWGSEGVVITRFTDDGSIDDAWGNETSCHEGSCYYGMRAPAGLDSLETVDARLTVGLEDAPATVERIYFAAKYENSSEHRLYLARIAAGGKTLSQNSSVLPVSFTQGAGSLTAMTAGDRLFVGAPGVVMAVRGRGSEGDRTALIQSVGGGFLELGSSAVLAGPGLRIHWMAMRADGTIDAVGTEAGQALYVRYDARSSTVLLRRRIDLPCPSGASLGSAADAVFRPAAVAPDVVLLGRTQCSGPSGAYQQLLRIADIDGTPVIRWAVATAGPSLSTCSSLADECLASHATPSERPHLMHVVTPALTLAHVAIDGAHGRVLGWDETGDPDAPTIMPSFKSGAAHRSAHIVGYASWRSPSGAPVFGLGRVATDRIFTDGANPRP